MRSAIRLWARVPQLALEPAERRLQLPVRLLFGREALLGLREASPKARDLPILIVQVRPEAVDLPPQLRTRLLDDVVQHAAGPLECGASSFLLAGAGSDRLLGPVDGVLFSGHPLLLKGQPTHEHVAPHSNSGQPVDGSSEEPNFLCHRVTLGAVARGRRLGTTVRGCECDCRQDERTRHLQHENPHTLFREDTRQDGGTFPAALLAGLLGGSAGDGRRRTDRGVVPPDSRSRFGRPRPTWTTSPAAAIRRA